MFCHIMVRNLRCRTIPHHVFVRQHAMCKRLQFWKNTFQKDILCWGYHKGYSPCFSMSTSFNVLTKDHKTLQKVKNMKCTTKDKTITPLGSFMRSLNMSAWMAHSNFPNHQWVTRQLIHYCCNQQIFQPFTSCRFVLQIHISIYWNELHRTDAI